MNIALVFLVLIAALIGLGFMISDSTETHQDLASANAQVEQRLSENDQLKNQIATCEAEKTSLNEINAQLALEISTLKNNSSNVEAGVMTQPAGQTKAVNTWTPTILLASVPSIFIALWSVLRNKQPATTHRSSQGQSGLRKTYKIEVTESELDQIILKRRGKTSLENRR